MSTVTPVLTITPGQTIQIPQPLGAGQLEQLILDNLSTYVLQVQIGPNVSYQAPLVEDSYDLTEANNQPVTITAIQLAGDVSTSGSLTLTWNVARSGGVFPIALSGPAEVAAATAAALLTAGIPNVLTTVHLGTFTVNAGAPEVWIDVHQYASVTLVGHQITAGVGGLLWQFQPTGVSTPIRSGTGYAAWTTPGVNYGPTVPVAEFNVSGPFLQVQLAGTAGGAPGVTFDLWGSNRSVPSNVPQVNGLGSVGTYLDSVPSAALVAGNTYQFSQAGNSPAVLQGAVRAEVIVSGTTCKGQVQIQFSDEFGNLRTIDLIDTSDPAMHAFNGNQVAEFDTAVPYVPWTLQFTCTTSGTATVIVRFTSKST